MTSYVRAGYNILGSIVLTLFGCADAFAAERVVTYMSSDRTTEFTVGSYLAEFGPTEDVQLERRRQGKRPADRIGGEIKNCSSPAVRCLDAESAGVYFAVDLEAMDHDAAYVSGAWTFQPRCLSKMSTDKCLSAAIRFSRQGRQPGFFIFDRKIGVVFFGLLDKRDGGVTQEFILDTTNGERRGLLADAEAK